MNRLAWWFRIVGALYVLLGVANTYGLIQPQFVAGSLPMADDPVAVQAFVDGWSAFALEMLAIGTFAVWASRDALRHVSAGWLIVWLEVFHGILGDVYLIARGYDAAAYIAFTVVHAAVIVTGVLFLRRASGEMAADATAAAPARI